MSPCERGAGAQVPGGVGQEAGGALDGVLGPPALVPRLEHLAEAASGHGAPVALEVVPGEDDQAAQTLLRAQGHGAALPEPSRPAPRWLRIPAAQLPGRRLAKGRRAARPPSHEEEPSLPCKGGESQT